MNQKRADEIEEKLRECDQEIRKVSWRMDELRRELVKELSEFEVGDIIERQDGSSGPCVIERILPRGKAGYRNYLVEGRKILKNDIVGKRLITLFQDYNIPKTSGRASQRYIKIGCAERWRPGEQIDMLDGDQS
ncbi:MAG: hypothetical protein A3K03_04515 [Bdellovibrionales bacterium RIFOXYD1_FULL_44_7]|nr:MAG: hypothetical protein A3K03_04515 [Bdellovibrionales bacterium RIFOXYD1_FULL_44_7]